ncbi:SET domain-containing protein 5 [Coniothyrium glycines]
MHFHSLLILLYASITTVVANSVTCPAFNWRSFPAICRGPPEVYTVEESPGKGLGVFAAHDLQVGDIVMQETPVIQIEPPKVKKGSPYPMSMVSSLVLEQFNALTIEQQKDVLSLTLQIRKADEVSVDRVGAIFKNNAYNTGDHISLFPKIARINHSCRPNLSYYWNASRNRKIVYATRPIKKGEEVFVSYISLLLAQEDRQRYLDRYGFKCHCEACAQERVAMQLSDQRRTTISKAFTDFAPELVLTPPKSKAALQQARNNAKASIQLAELVQEEGLADYYAKAYRIVAISHARIGEWQPAAVWANKGYELKVREDPKSALTMEMHHLTSNFIANWESELKNQSQGHEN